MGIANKITSIRILLAPVIAIVMVSGMPHATAWAAGLFVAAMATDIADGRVARAMGQASSLGGRLDGLGDKLLWNLLLFDLVFIGIVPFWFAAIIFARDAMATEFKSMALIKNVKIPVTSFEGKAKVALQTLGICFAFAGLLGREYALMADAVVSSMFSVCLGCFVASLFFGLLNFHKDVVKNFGKVFF